MSFFADSIYTSPPFIAGSSLNYHPETRTLYLFGGFNYGNFDANVYRVQLDEWCWQKVEIRSKIKPMGRCKYKVLGLILMFHDL